MKYICFAESDIGITKKTNQDSLCIKVADTADGQIVLAIVCDGMGGLSKGELASATVVRAFSSWFEKKLPIFLQKFSWQDISDSWERMAKDLNYKILEYGDCNHVKLGTTLTAMLIIQDRYMIMHIGDSRAYSLSENLKQLTEDHTVVAREVRRGTMTPEQAENDPRRNVLLQCVGASRAVLPDISFGDIRANTVYMLCSDGFRHVIDSAEIYKSLNPGSIRNKETMKKNLHYLIDLVKQRREKDNISVLLIKACK